MSGTRKGITPAALRALLTGDLENYEVAMASGGIEAQEAEGQSWFNAAGNLLPRTLLNAEWSEIEAMGVKRIGEYDDLFLIAEFPAGWVMRPTEHSMWSVLVDENGVERLEIFYKAAFYDRNAHFWPKR